MSSSEATCATEGDSAREQEAASEELQRALATAELARVRAEAELERAAGAWVAKEEAEGMQRQERQALADQLKDLQATAARADAAQAEAAKNAAAARAELSVLQAEADLASAGLRRANQALLIRAATLEDTVEALAMRLKHAEEVAADAHAGATAQAAQVGPSGRLMSFHQALAGMTPQPQHACALPFHYNFPN